MPRYEYRCQPYAHEFELWFEMGKAPAAEQCPLHKVMAIRVFSFYHQEDRRHMRAGVSATTGRPYAASRTEERAIEKEMNIEFIGPREIPQAWRNAAAYKAHVDTGGERLPFHDVIPEEKIEMPPLTKYMDDANYRRPEASEPLHDPSPDHQAAQLQAVMAAADASQPA